MRGGRRDGQEAGRSVSQTQGKRLKETEIRERKREMKEKARDGNSDREGSKKEIDGRRWGWRD